MGRGLVGKGTMGGKECNNALRRPYFYSHQPGKRNKVRRAMEGRVGTLELSGPGRGAGERINPSRSRPALRTPLVRLRR